MNNIIKNWLSQAYKVVKKEENILTDMKLARTETFNI